MSHKSKLIIFSFDFYKIARKSMALPSQHNLDPTVTQHLALWLITCCLNTKHTKRGDTEIDIKVKWNKIIASPNSEPICHYINLSPKTAFLLSLMTKNKSTSHMNKQKGSLRYQDLLGDWHLGGPFCSIVFIVLGPSIKKKYKHINSIIMAELNQH